VTLVTGGAVELSQNRPDCYQPNRSSDAAELRHRELFGHSCVHGRQRYQWYRCGLTGVPSDWYCRMGQAQLSCHPAPTTQAAFGGFSIGSPLV
jgi:hypothetical protein